MHISALYSCFTVFRFDHSVYKLSFTGNDAWGDWDRFLRAGMSVYSLKDRPGVTADETTNSLIKWEKMLREVGPATSV